MTFFDTHYPIFKNYTVKNLRVIKWMNWDSNPDMSEHRT